MEHSPPDVPPGHTFVGYTPDGQVITATGGVVIDDDYLAAEAAMAEEHQRHLDALIAKHGSLEAVYEYQAAQASRDRRERVDAFAHHRIERTRVRRRPTTTVVRFRGPTRTRGRRSHGARRAGGVRSGSDPGSGSDPDSESPRRRRNPRHVRHALAALLERIGGVL